MAPKRRKLNSQQPSSTENAPEAENTPVSAPIPPTSQGPSLQDFTLPFPEKPDKSIPCIRYTPSSSDSSSTEDASSSGARLIFTHGAGGGLESASMQDFSRGFANVAELVCFKGTMHMGNRVKAFRAVVENEESVVAKQAERGLAALGGRSMGARAAAMMAASAELEERVEAVVLVSFPLVSAKGERREEVLLGIPEGVDVLFISGDRDGMCELRDLKEVMGRMQGRSWLMVVENADHGMELRRKSEGEREVRERTGQVAAQWLKVRDAKKRRGNIKWDEEESKVVEDKWYEDIE